MLEDAERLMAAWNERQALRAPMIFSPTIGAAIKAGYWFLWAHNCSVAPRGDDVFAIAGQILRGKHVRFWG